MTDHAAPATTDDDYPLKAAVERTSLRADFRWQINAAETAEALLNIEARIEANDLAEDGWLNGLLEARYRQLGAD